MEPFTPFCSWSTIGSFCTYSRICWSGVTCTYYRRIGVARGRLAHTLSPWELVSSRNVDSKRITTLCRVHSSRKYTTQYTTPSNNVSRNHRKSTKRDWTLYLGAFARQHKVSNKVPMIMCKLLTLFHLVISWRSWNNGPLSKAPDPAIEMAMIGRFYIVFGVSYSASWD